MSASTGTRTSDVPRIPALIAHGFLWAAVALVPLLTLVFLLGDIVHDPVWAGPTFHFYIVTFTSLIAFILATLVRIAAGKLRDPRVLFLSLAFLGITGIFLTHALTTPGMLVSMNPWVGFSSRLSVFVGAIFLLLSTFYWKPSIRRGIVDRQREITWLVGVVVAGYLVLALGTSWSGQATGEQFDLIANPRTSDIVAGISLTMLVITILRYVRMYRIDRSPLVAGLLVSTIFLAQGQLSMAIAPLWHASWWEYHVLLLFGFSAALTGLSWEYTRNRNLEGVLGGLLLRDSITQLQQGYTEVIVALVEAVEAKDVYTRGHTQRVAELSVLIGQHLGLSSEQLHVVHRAALLHDIGKIGIPDAILNKPGPLTAEEFAVIQEHPLRGHRIIQDVRSLRPEIGGVRHHHERLDGSGYPDGLIGDEIPLEARIIAVADVFDALTSARPYREAWSIDKALEILREERGAKLDPTCVDALISMLPTWSGKTAKPFTQSRVPAATMSRMVG